MKLAIFQVIFWERGFVFCLMKVENLMLVEFKENISEDQNMLCYNYW